MDATTEIVFQQVGAGPDVVFLHGLLGRGGQWDGCARILGARRRCWILELPGISASAAVADASLAGLSGWLEHAVEELGIGEFELAGASWGGAIALKFAANSPKRRQVRRLVLAAPAHPFWTPSARQQWLLTPPWSRIVAWMGAHLPRAAYSSILAPSYGERARLRPASVAAYRATLRQPGLSAAVAAYAGRWREDQRQLHLELGGIAAPVTLIWGERDRVVPAATAPALQKALPRAELFILPGLGHLPYEELPEAFCSVW